ncbi:MAG: hypothetical protein US86_C0022G0003 [Candidatus Daviesbacteria bacterium GW2011_GWA2_38_24]|uniref:Phosphoglycerate mutase n=1 Tax=Candidatus Daviesbacteria bacterium GW2011_GWA2_38_24 TaxID=1618422 RepID=A0A0G0JMP0_9BACT|nr:MAG: hypothetical protein US86_C0022G0003 [Candidatus Daviesbacteria bacterium GW2011_GWA2_38_24]
MNFEKPKNIEKGRNIDLTIHLMRHGKKRPDGNLSETGAREAQERGAEMGVMKNVKAYTSRVPRVVETAQAVQQGAEIYNKFNQRNRSALSDTLLRAPGTDQPPRFFKETILKRLADAHTAPENNREQRIREAEHQNMQEWLSHDDDFIDETTNSPKNVARAVAHLLVRQIDMSEHLKSGSDVDLLDVTHEFMLAAIIRYAVKKQNEDGSTVSGEEIMREKQSIDYLESLDIEVHIDENGKKTVSLEINGEPYILDMDTLRILSDEYKEGNINTQSN